MNSAEVQLFEEKFTQVFSKPLLDVLKSVGEFRRSQYRKAVNLYVDGLRIAYDDSDMTEWYIENDPISINDSISMNDRALLLGLVKARGLSE
jgi:hypothetical protein